MDTKAKELKSGEFIFAKLRGYPAWPARVQSYDGKKYSVYFYGTGDTANIPANMVFDYEENKAMFLTKPVKRRDFNEGIKQLELDLNKTLLEQIVGPLVEAPANVTVDYSAINETMDTTANDTVADAMETSQNDTAVEDPDDQGALVIDEGKTLLTISPTLEPHISNAVVTLQDSVHKCSTCTRGFLTARECRLHELFHVQATIKKETETGQDIEKPFKCENCGVRFVLWSTLEAHSVIHKPYPHVCHCGIGYYNKKDFQGHQFLVHSKPVKTEVDKTKTDEKLFKKLENLGKNKSEGKKKMKHSDGKSVGFHKKTSEKRQTKKKSELMDKENSVKLKRGPNGYGCPHPHCPVTYQKYKDLAQHYAEHVDKMPFVCEHCSRQFLDRGRYQVHKKVAHGPKDYTCRYCAKKFTQINYLITHIRIHTGERPYKCNQCSKAFNQTSALTLHLLVHSGLREHICRYCQKTFKSTGSLQIHERIHTKDRKYKCTYCPQDFTDPSSYKRHERIHTGRVMYTCQVCPKTFIDFSAYTIHKRRHENDKRYKCTECEMKYYTLSDMKLHRNRIHYKLKEFGCDICEKKFACKYNMEQHIIKVHGNRRLPKVPKEKIYQCDICKIKMSQKSSLADHLQSHAVGHLDDNGMKIYKNFPRYKNKKLNKSKP